RILRQPCMLLFQVRHSVCSGDGIVQIAVIERVTAPDALGRHPAALEQPVAVDGLVAVLRAGWRKAATGRQKHRECHLIEADQPHADVLHAVPRSSVRQSRARENVSRRSSSSAPYSASAADARAVTTISHPGATCESRFLTIARSRRFTWF